MNSFSKSSQASPPPSSPAPWTRPSCRWGSASGHGRGRGSAPSGPGRGPRSRSGPQGRGGRRAEGEGAPGITLADLREDDLAQASLLDLLSNSLVSPAEAGQRGAPGSKPTAYGPGASGSREGGFETRGKNLEGKYTPHTLDEFRAGNIGYVTLAGNKANQGKTFTITQVTYRSPLDGKTYTLENVPGLVHDTGGAFTKGRPDKIDIAIGDFRGFTDKTAAPFLDNVQIGKLIETAGLPQANPVGLLPPGRAQGGDIAPNQYYTVGELGPEMFMTDAGQMAFVGDQGPELFQSQQPGTIYPFDYDWNRHNNFKWDQFPGLLTEIRGRADNWERFLREQTPSKNIEDRRREDPTLQIDDEDWKRILQGKPPRSKEDAGGPDWGKIMEDALQEQMRKEKVPLPRPRPKQQSREDGR